ncbi:MAG: RluA family pseudouridine synthase [Christensenellales bacterium]
MFVVQDGQDIAVRRFLRLACPTAPDWVLRKAFQARQVKVNGTRITADHILKSGDEVIFYTSWSAKDIPIVYEDEHILICNKPANVNSDRNAQSPFSLLSWAEERACGAYIPVLCHRLDNQTSGLLLLAKHPDAADTIDAAMRSGNIHRVYTAVIVGVPMPPKATATAYLLKDAKAARVTIVPDNRPDARNICTSYETIKTEDSLSQLSITLHTGRTHQIRAHMAFLGHPVLGDDAYGSRPDNKARRANELCLCATELTFDKLPAPLDYLSRATFQIEASFSLGKYTQEERS